MYQSLPRTKKYLAKLLLLCSVFHLCLGISGQSTGRVTPKINLSAKNVTITEVFKAIKSQTGKIVWFMNEDVDVDRKVTVKFENASLDEVMKNLFDAASDFTWSFEEEKIILRKKKQDQDNVITSSVEPSSVRADSLPGIITVSGKVTDEKGSPIIGATVVVKGTRIGAVTGDDGRFSLEGVKPRALLTVTSISYLTKDIPLQGKSFVGNIRLKEYVGVLDETVVIAYGTTTRRLSTGNVSTIKAIDIEKQPINNPLLAIQGRVPGVFVEQATGISGSGIQIRIQGLNSIGKGNDPLFVIDGVPFISQLLPTNNNSILGKSGNDVGSFGAQNGNPLSFINPSDIESIEVLKDADATSIYGSRAANGAVLITTKKGKIGKAKFDLRLQTGVGKITNNLNVLNTKQYLEIRNEALKNNNNSEPSDFDYDINGTWEKNRFTNWQKKLIGGNSIYNDIQTSYSGGNSSTQFLLSGGYHRETTVFPGNYNDQKGSVHFNLNNVSLNQRFHLQFSGSYLVDINSLPGSDLTNSALTLPPNAPSLYNKDGSLNWQQTSVGTSSFINPLASFLYQTQSIRTKNLISNAILDYQILPGLSIKSNIGYTDLGSEGANIVKLVSFQPENRSFSKRIATFSNNSIKSWLIEPQITYDMTMGKGKLNFLIGSTINQNNSDGELMRATGFNSDLIIDDIGSATEIIVPTTIRTTYKYNALFGRVNFNWEERYVINVNVRRDGSSRFGSENLFHNFGSIGGAWIFSTEPFVKDKVSFFSFGKLRGSFGTTGNDQIGDYTFLNLYMNSPNWGQAYQGGSGLEIVGLPNPFLQWEETRKLQFGLDLGFLKERILFSSNVYRNRSSNQILNYALSVVTGFDGIISNFPAKVQNSGYELSLNSINIKSKKFTWSSNINATIARNKLLAFPGLANSSYFSSALVIGKSLNLIRAYRFAGVDSQTGLYQVKDSKGNSTSNPDPLTDRTVYINTSPTFFGGFQNSFSFKGIDLQILFQFVRQKAINNYFGSFPGFLGNQPVSVLNRWQHSGDVASIQKVTNGFDIFNSTSAALSSDKAYSDASYIRLKNLSLSWSIPDNWRAKTHLENCRLFIQGQNLLTITKYVGLDPETKSINSLPPLRIITTGINITL
jgi:TonB-linked SusC/RagA family outer membrane protein